MAEELYPLIFVLIMIIFVVIDTWILAKNENGGRSELRAADRYAVAEQILCHHPAHCQGAGW